LRNESPAKSSSYVFEGPSALVERSLENVAIDDIAKKNTLTGNIKWMALESRYFMTSLIPIKEQPAAVHLATLPGNVVEAQYVEPQQTLDPGSRQQFEFRCTSTQSMNIRQAGMARAHH
jgi:YidC/Oxa1 family membrane protein insertase